MVILLSLLLCFLIYITCIGTVAILNYNNFSYEQRVASYVFDINEHLIGSVSNKFLLHANLREFPLLLRRTVLAVEDLSFYSNFGVSLWGTIKAIIFFIPSLIKGERPIGGSTIGQQLARTILQDRSWSINRKLKETILSIYMAITVPKDKILELYMNNAYFGGGVYGFKAAAKVIFKKELKDLEPHEVACLVGILKGVIFSPLVNAENSKYRRDYILKRMHKLDIITTKQLEEALKHNVPNVKRPYVFTVIQNIKTELSNLFPSDKDKDKLSIYSTIDLGTQTIAQEELLSICTDLEISTQWLGPVAKDRTLSKQTLLDHSDRCGSNYVPVYAFPDGTYEGIGIKGSFCEEDLEKYKKVSPINFGDLVILHKHRKRLTNFPSFLGQVVILSYVSSGRTRPGDVLASVGTVDPSLSQYDITISRRPFGSCWKIFIYLLAMDLGIGPKEIIPDRPAKVENGKLLYIPLEEWTTNVLTVECAGQAWYPKNWNSVIGNKVIPESFFGEIVFLDSFKHSRNIPFLNVAINRIGLDRLKTFFVQFGLLDPQEEIFPGSILGAIETTSKNFSLACLRAILNKKINLRQIREVRENGSVIAVDNNEEDLAPLVKKKSVKQLMEAMLACATSGTASVGLNFSPVLAKTGTSSNNKDAVCCVIAKGVIIFVSVCRKNHDNHSDQSLGQNVYGARFPVLCAKKIMDRIKTLDSRTGPELIDSE